MANAHLLAAPPPCGPATHLEVAHQRLGVRQKGVDGRVPGADLQPVLLRERPNPRLGFWADLEVVLDYDRVTVEDEAAARRVGFHISQQVDHHAHETRSEALEGQVPLAVPVRMADDNAQTRWFCSAHAASVVSYAQNRKSVPISSRPYFSTSRTGAVRQLARANHQRR